MKGGFEELKNLDANEVYAQTHVSQSVFEKIIHKRFDKLKIVQTKGIIRVLEGQYNLDLSIWLNEYENYLQSLQPQAPMIDKLLTESNIAKEKNFPKAWVITPIIILLLGIIFFYAKNDSSPTIQESNLSVDTNETNVTSLLNAPLEANSTVQLVEQNLSENNATITPMVEKNVTEKKPTSNFTFEFTPYRKLWLGVYYLNDNNESDFRDDINQTIKLDASRPQILVTGPSFFKIQLGTSTIESKTDGVVRYTYDPKDKKLKFITKQEFEAIRPPRKP